MFQINEEEKDIDIEISFDEIIERQKSIEKIISKIKNQKDLLLKEFENSKYSDSRECFLESFKKIERLGYLFASDFNCLNSLFSELSEEIYVEHIFQRMISSYVMDSFTEDEIFEIPSFKLKIQSLEDSMKEQKEYALELKKKLTEALIEAEKENRILYEKIQKIEEVDSSVTGLFFIIFCSWLIIWLSKRNSKKPKIQN